MPIIYFGGGTIGEGAFSTPHDVKGLLDVLQSCKIEHIDTAGRYPGSAPGESERLIGAAKAAERGFTIDTKILVTGKGPGQGSLTKSAIDESLTRSLKVLGVDQVNILYCHIPDTITPMEETAAALHGHWTSGRFKNVGLSNFKAHEVEKVLALCDQNGWVKPTVYQGQYNAICRNMETQLLPLLRRHGIVYVAFSPLAGGFLTGNFSLGRDLSGTRFEEGNRMGAHYKPMYDNEKMHSAIRTLHDFLEPRGISMAGASLRWLYYHSVLGEEDGIVLGATKTAQIERNVAEIGEGRLEDSIVDAFEKTWDQVREVAP